MSVNQTVRAHQILMFASSEPWSKGSFHPKWSNWNVWLGFSRDFSGV
jgi:hypothetical protein